MPYKKIFLVLLLCLFTSLSFSQTPFEGKVVYQFEEDGDSQTMTYLVKDQKFRIETPEAEGTLIYDMKAGKMLMLMDGEKMYMEMPMDVSKEVEEKVEKSVESFTKTGETKEILGHTCEKFLFNSDDFKGEAWMTKELGGLMLLDNPQKMQSSTDAWRQDILEQGYLPIVLNEINDDGEVINSFKITEIEPKTLDAKLFAPPADYQKFEMPNMNIDSFK
ncbi:MAG TPA: DUF4412 domain-containing protein [Ignavibacteriaceae bacterium]